MSGNSNIILDGSLTSLDVASNTQTVTITNNSITTNSDYSFTIAASSTSGKFTVQSASGYYIGHTGAKNTLNSSETYNSNTHDNTITITTDGNAEIAVGSYHLVYNAAGSRFRYYTSAQQAIQLYKLEETTGGGTPTPTKTATALSFPEASYSANLGESFTAPTATLTAEGATLTGKTITYSINPTSVATIDATTGAVSLIAAGTATVTASFAGDDTYQQSTAKYTLTVRDPNVHATHTKVTSVADVFAGGKYIIGTNSYAAGAISNKTMDFVSILSHKSGDDLTLDAVNTTNKAYEVELEKNGDGWNLKFFDGKYLHGTSGKTDLSYETTATAWNISIEADGTAKISIATRQILYSNETGFKNYSSTNVNNSGYTTVYLYKNVNSVKPAALPAITISTDEGWGTYYSESKYVLPEGLKAYIADQKTDGTFELSELATAGDVIDAAVPVLVKGAKGSYQPEASNATAGFTTDDVAQLGNCLHGMTTAGTTPTVAGNNYYYKLTYKDSQDLGFYWGATDGGVFNMTGNNRAYLVLPATTSNAKGFALPLDDDTDAITTVAARKAQTNNARYNLAGQRLSNTTKGQLYIMNGKKYIAK